MRSHPAGFREWLSGTCFTSEPLGWRLKVSPGRAVVRPTRYPLIFVSIILLGFASILGGGTYSDLSEPGASIWHGDGLTTIVAATLILGFFGAIFAFVLREWLRGAHMVHVLSDRRISLPRHRLTTPHEDALEWRLVSGNWVGPAEAQKEKQAALSELQLIVRTADGPVAYAVVGGYAGTMTEQAREVSRATGIPLEIVKQHQGVSASPPARMPDSWAS